MPLTLVVIDPARLVNKEYSPPSATLYTAKKRKNRQTSNRLQVSCSASLSKSMGDEVSLVVGFRPLRASRRGNDEGAGAGTRDGRMTSRRNGITRQMTCEYESSDIHVRTGLTPGIRKASQKPTYCACQQGIRWKGKDTTFSAKEDAMAKKAPMLIEP